jgi:cellobiose phosphorylase
MPPHWRGFTMRREFRGARYHIRVSRGGRRELRVDGRVIAGDLIPSFGDGREHEVTLQLGSGR